MHTLKARTLVPIKDRQRWKSFDSEFVFNHCSHIRTHSDKHYALLFTERMIDLMLDSCNLWCVCVCVCVCVWVFHERHEIAALQQLTFVDSSN
jgi:hypothetical protein